jgi:microsomal dipeptidase-like Zn-dependent dipeptidase
VLAMRGCPANDEKKWEGFESDSSKVATAMAKGAIGVMICANFGEEDRGIGRWRLQPGNYKPGFLVFGVGEQVVDFLLMKKDETYRMLERRVRDEFESLNKELKPMSVATGSTAIMKVKVENDPTRIGKNVLGMIKGTDPVVGDKVIVLGAHLDHLGIEYNQIYNGADDNASGTSVVMEVARVMMANKVKPKRTILFACWGGEERGLLGSRYYAEHPSFPIDKTVMDFNMDMVGLGNKLSFPGIYYAPEIWKIIKANLSEATLEFIEPSRGGPGGSDHTPFITRGVPAFALMTTPWNGHPDYHQPGDDADKISVELLGKVAQFVYDNALLIADHDGNLILANRLPVYIHKSANIIDIHPIPYEPGLALLDSLQNEWIDIQFVEVPPDSLHDSDVKLAEMVKSLDAAAEEETDISRMMGPMARMFRSRRDQTISVMGLNGVQSVNSDLADLRIAGKLGAKFFMFDGVDGKWITANEGLTEDGKKAIQEMNNKKLLILLQNLSENAIVQILETSKHPVVIAGVKGVDSISDSLVQKVNEKDGLIALSFCPDKIDKLVERIEALKQRTKISHIGLYPCPEKDLDIKNLNQMLNLTIELNQKGYQADEIKDILGANFQTIFDKINPRDQRRMRRPF